MASLNSSLRCAVPDLVFEAAGAGAIPDSISPAIAVSLRVRNRSPEPVHSISLRCQLRIEAPGRRYGEVERGRLVDLFGEPARWGQTLRSLLWANLSVVVGPFERMIDIEVPIPCTYDFNIAVAKYFDALEGGDVPLLFLFSGTVFYANHQGALQIEQIPWNRECAFRLPVQTWKSMMDFYYPNTAWLALRKDVFDRLHQYKMQRGIPTWERVVESILPAAHNAAESGG